MFKSWCEIFVCREIFSRWNSWGVMPCVWTHSNYYRACWTMVWKTKKWLYNCTRGAAEWEAQYFRELPGQMSSCLYDGHWKTQISLILYKLGTGSAYRQAKRIMNVQWTYFFEQLWTRFLTLLRAIKRGNLSSTKNRDNSRGSGVIEVHQNKKYLIIGRTWIRQIMAVVFWDKSVIANGCTAKYSPSGTCDPNSKTQ